MKPGFEAFANLCHFLPCPLSKDQPNLMEQGVLRKCRTVQYYLAFPPCKHSSHNLKIIEINNLKNVEFWVFINFVFNIISAISLCNF
jgi:hypothetical protein